MNANVLVLNQDYQPLSICSIQRSMKLIFLDKAELLHDHPTKKLRTTRQQYDYPSVIRLRSYIRIPYSKVVLTRRNIMRRDGFKCQYCGKKSNLTIDHVLPKSRGGKDTWENLTTACDKCNVKKGNRTPKEALMPLRSEPYRPVPITFFRDFNGGVQEPWKPYLYMT
ncbi:HNH endonuclease [Balneola vulgaris]|jgi:5-methylcytosine-specific restriction endonuclease McrA|uniref:HNH endonuclease n=1 Tax=Balneola vulgaris TaxID=287535 RepID=UPI000476D51C|nr:HNH endonuclease [Balneola vulgaris]